jgi:tyrosine-protein kinase Etk/Wzc
MNDFADSRLYDAPPPDDMPLSSHFELVLARWRMVLAIALSVFALGLLYAVFAEPVYRVDATIQVNEQSGSGNSPLRDVAALLDDGSKTAAELELLRARIVIDGVVRGLHLNIVAQPRYVPVIGQWAARHYKDKGIASPMLGLSGFAWGGERFDADVFESGEASRSDDTDSLNDVPFTVTAEEGHRYALADHHGNVVLHGEAGRLVAGSYHGLPFNLRVTELDARPGTQFELKRMARIEAVMLLQQQLNIEEKAKQSGIISVTLEGDDKTRIRTILSAVVSGYVRQNREYRNGEAGATLRSLEGSMPKVKKALEEAEMLYTAFRDRTGTVDLDEQSRLLLGQEVDVQSRILDLTQKRIGLIAQYADTNPAVVALDQNMNELKAKQGELESRAQRLPNTEQEGLRLLRDVRVNTELYTNLLNTRQQLQIAQESQIGNVRVVDAPELPVYPVKPKRMLILALSLCMGMALGVAAPFAQRTLWGRVEHSEQLEHALGVPVYAVVPHSRAQRRLMRRQGRMGQDVHVLASNIPEDVAVDAIRSLRTTLQFTTAETKSNVVMVTSSQPNAGKSFLCANLAALFAAGGKRVLLIDADVRNGKAHHHFGLQMMPGLPDAIDDETLERAVQRSAVNGLDVLTRGTVARSLDLFNDSRFKTLLEMASRLYDIVVVDTAPILALHDAAAIGRLGTTTLLCVRHGQSSMPEIREAERRLRNAGIGIAGVVLNDVPRRQAAYGAYGAYGVYGEKTYA